MSKLILHHHDPSPFAEKIRLVMGIKNLSWSSVQVSMVMPRPQMTALTGGYRKIPVLQAGANIYCDTALIVRELERRHPSPTVFPTGAGMAIALAWWSDKPFFDAGASLAMATDDVPTEVIEDRRGFFTHLDFDSFRSDALHLHGQVAAHAQLIEDQLAAGQPYLGGDAPGWGDILAYFPVWMARGYLHRADEVFRGLDAMAAWAGRMAEIGHGRREELDAAGALAVAREATPEFEVGVDDPFLALAAGDPVAVTPTDYGKDPVLGELVRLDRRVIAVRRKHPETGEVLVHFPRIGFRVDHQR